MSRLLLAWLAAVVAATMVVVGCHQKEERDARNNAIVQPVPHRAGAGWF